MANVFTGIKIISFSKFAMLNTSYPTFSFRCFWVSLAFVWKRKLFTTCMFLISIVFADTSTCIWENTLHFRNFKLGKSANLQLTIREVFVGSVREELLLIFFWSFYLYFFCQSLGSRNNGQKSLPCSVLFSGSVRLMSTTNSGFRSWMASAILSIATWASAM